MRLPHLTDSDTAEHIRLKNMGHGHKKNVVWVRVDDDQTSAILHFIIMIRQCFLLPPDEYLKYSLK